MRTDAILALPKRRVILLKGYFSHFHAQRTPVLPKSDIWVSECKENAAHVARDWLKRFPNKIPGKITALVGRVFRMIARGMMPKTVRRGNRSLASAPIFRQRPSARESL